MRAPTNHTEPHISSITIIVHNQLARLKAVHSRSSSLSMINTRHCTGSFGPLSSPPQELYSNSFSGAVPTQIGQLTQMEEGMYLSSNQFCDDVPTQVQALSSGVTSGWAVTTGNSFGTICGWQSYMADSRFPTMDGSTSTTSIDYSHQNLTGTIPTQASRFSAHCHHLLNDASSFSQRGLIRCTMIPPSLPRLSSSGC